MKSFEESTFNGSPMIAVAILIFATSCFSYKPIHFSSDPGNAERAAGIEPGKKYSLELDSGLVVFMNIKAVTPDTVFGDVQRIMVTKKSRVEGISNTYIFKNVSVNGKPNNPDWLWADPNTRLIGLGHVDTKRVSKISVLKFRPGVTVALALMPLLIAIVIVTSQPIPVIAGI